MSTVRLPAPFLGYACQRTMVCCHLPLRAPVDAEDEARTGAALASSAAGRAYLPIFNAGFERVGAMRAFKHVDAHCVHLRQGDDGREPGCSLHFLGGLDGLAFACRNYPRWVTQLPDDAGLEALFLLACPTAAALLVADPGPFRFVEVPLAGWHYPPTRDAAIEQVARAEVLRAGWWALTAEGRDDPDHLIAVMNALVTSPLIPPDRVTPGPPHPVLVAALRPPELDFVHDALGRLPQRGPSYRSFRGELGDALDREIAAPALREALAIAPGLLFAYLDHLIPFAGMHDDRPTFQWLRTSVRRTVAVGRLAAALTPRVPFAVDRLFADLFTGVMHLDASGTPAAPRPAEAP